MATQAEVKSSKSTAWVWDSNKGARVNLRVAVFAVSGLLLMLLLVVLRGLNSSVLLSSPTTDYCMGPCINCSASVRHTVNEIVSLVTPATMLSPALLQANKAAVDYVTKAGLRGDIVEAGVAAGGSAAMLALTAARLGSPRRMHLFDTFSGLPPANASVDGKKAMSWTGKIAFGEQKVRDYLVGAGLAAESLVFHVGDVRDTLQNATLLKSTPLPCEIAVLRLDTDWYESHVVLLKTLYHRVVPGGAIISDDYGFWPGAKRAIDEWFALEGHSAPIVKIDFTGIMWCKPGGSKPCDLESWRYA